jgi:hypothetical protein
MEGLPLRLGLVFTSSGTVIDLREDVEDGKVPEEDFESFGDDMFLGKPWKMFKIRCPLGATLRGTGVALMFEKVIVGGVVETSS